MFNDANFSVLVSRSRVNTAAAAAAAVQFAKDKQHCRSHRFINISIDIIAIHLHIINIINRNITVMTIITLARHEFNREGRHLRAHLMVTRVKVTWWRIDPCRMVLIDVTQ